MGNDIRRKEAIILTIADHYQSVRTKPFVIFTLIILAKSYLAWVVIFGTGVSLSTIFTELPFVWTLFCLIEWFASRRKLAAYLGVNLLLTTIFFSVIMYYKYYGVIATYHSLKQVNQVTAVNKSVVSLMDPYFLLIFIDIVVLAYLLIRGNKAVIWKQLSARRERRWVVTAMFVLSAVLCFVNIYPNRASMNELVKAEEMGILNYQAYTILASDQPELVDDDQITQANINALKGLSPANGLPANPEQWGAAEGRNVILIQLESFQKFLLGLELGGQEITPNLNRLVANSTYFPHFYQQVGQGNTSDAEFVVNTSFYIPYKGPATMSYAYKDLPSMPKLLEQHGYNTATFHTNVVEFWNRGVLYEGLGFDRYYDSAFYEDEDKIFFGSSDEVLYDKTADVLEQLDAEEKPFYAHVISMTAHHPFTIPAEKHKMELPTEYEGTFVGDYIRSQNYADYALGLFIDDLKQRGVWDSSLIVLYGDHQGLPIYSLDRADLELMKGILGRDYGYSDMINVPLIVHDPAQQQGREMSVIGGQIDILPTLANLLGVSLGDYLHFGQDLLNTTSNLLPERYYLPSGSLITDRVLFIPGEGYADGTHYPLLDHNNKFLTAAESEYERALELLKLSDSFVTKLPAREGNSNTAWQEQHGYTNNGGQDSMAGWDENIGLEDYANFDFYSRLSKDGFGGYAFQRFTSSGQETDGDANSEAGADGTAGSEAGGDASGDVGGEADSDAGDEES